MIPIAELGLTYQKCLGAVKGSLLIEESERRHAIDLAWQLANDPRLTSVLRDNLRAELEKLKAAKVEGS